MAQITLRNYLQETEDAIGAGRVDDALSRCQSVLTYFPESLEAQRLLGEIYLAQGRPEDAQHAFDWVLTNDPENVIAYCDRALVSERISDIDTALDCYQQAYELSRGNSKIREEFNRLSEQLGQQGFMFSRAGLARLYMRGDLLSQAEQEWEVILASAPDRLDARTGLLETYWRAGMLDRAEEVAEQILQDVPRCLKALLLLAAITMPKDALRSQELLRQAQTLDPDMLMAQELFADMIARTPNDPFLKLLEKKPVVLPVEDGAEARDASGFASPAVAGEEAYAAQEMPTTAQEITPDLLKRWSSSEAWQTDAAYAHPNQIVPDQSNAPISWNAENTALTANSADQQSLAPDTAQPLSSTSSAEFPWSLSGLVNPTADGQQQESQAEPWQLLQETLKDFDGHSSPFALDQDQSLPSWESGLDAHATSSTTYTNPWEAPVQEDAVSAPPTWLSMLTQSERQQLSAEIPLVSEAQTSAFTTENNAQPASVSTPPVTQAEPTPLDREAEADPPVIVNTADTALPTDLPSVSSDTQQKQEAKPMSSSVSDVDEESFFSPAWLKSLGAATWHGIEDHDANGATVAPSASGATWSGDEGNTALSNGTFTSKDSNQSASASSAISQPAVPAEASLEREALQRVQEEELHPLKAEQATNGTDPTSSTEAWATQGISSTSNIKPESHLSEQERQQQITTMEELDQQLLANGFVPLEPNSLATIAKEQEDSTVAEQEPHDTQHPSPQENEAFMQPGTLSTALAELGRYSSGATMPSSPTLPGIGDGQGLAEPEWIRALRTAPVPAASVEPTVSSPAQETSPNVSPGEVWNNPVEELSMPQMQVELPDTQATRIESMPSSTFFPTPPEYETQEITKVAISRKNPLLESGLETTMKRPAVRLQPLQQPPSIRETASGKNKGTVERSSSRVAPAKGSEGASSYPERLVRGYQHQLVGDYDEAMQEYRMIIRGAPDLLGEVVSNVRALLKLAPKYSAGYRVLGDAYMRQGEYLQAMEAYNKALTMAKKAKGPQS